MTQLALDDVERDALVGELDGVGVAQLVRREPPPHPGFGGDAPQLGAGGVARPGPPAGRTVDDAQERTDRHADTQVEPGAKVVPTPGVHADLAPPPALAVAYQDRSETRVEVVLGEPQRLVDPQPCAPEQHDQGPQAGAVDTVAGLAHDRDDFLHRGRIGRVAEPLVARRASGERRRPAAFSSGGTDMDSPLSGRPARPELHGAQRPVRNPEAWRETQSATASPPQLQH
jgi:hypothetical protein